MTQSYTGPDGGDGGAAPRPPDAAASARQEAEQLAPLHPGVDMPRLLLALLAERAGIVVFATGGIGGVHRSAHLDGDISADLGALAAHRVITVSAGAKSFLDLPRTLQYLETLSVPVIGIACDEFPAFTVYSSGIRRRRCQLPEHSKFRGIATCEADQETTWHPRLR